MPTPTPAVLAAALSAALVVAQSNDQDPGTSYHYRVLAPTPGQLLRLHQHFDVLGDCHGPGALTGPVDVIVMPEEHAAFLGIAPGAQLVGRGRPFHVIDLERRAQSMGPDLPDLQYLTVAEAEAVFDGHATAFPTLARKVDVSALPGGVRTHQNRPLLALKVSDNVAVDEDEPAIVVAAQHHARELNAPIMVTYGIEQILNGYATDPALQALVDGHELYFVAIANPDGVEHVWNVDALWRKNRRNNGTNFGVDTNRNYPFLFSLCGGSTVTSSETYRGPAAASEPETQAMINLIRLLRPEVYIDFHSYGQEVLGLYAPCVTLNPALAAFDQHYRTDLRTPMSYNTRDPSASGEAPHDHWATGGTLSYLIEVGTSFQPAYATTQAEAVRVWPGLRQALTVWQPSLRGHVRSSLGYAPLEATITFAPGQFTYGELTRSRARDGRYGLWLPLGTWDVTWSAAGHDSKTRTVTVQGYDQPQTIEVQLDPTSPPASIQKAGSERIGTVVTFTYTSPGDAGRVHLFGWSLGTSPGIDLGGLRRIPLNPDFLLEAAIRTNPFLAPTWGTLDGAGQAQCSLAIPNDALLVGLTTYVAGITWDPGYAFGIKKWSPPVSVTPLP
jgi:hypothetical protein